jgi:hypothetical protein
MDWNSPSNQKRLRRLFEEGFTAMDVAEPLVSFDAEQPSPAVRAVLDGKDFDLVGVRRHGTVCGYARRVELGEGTLGDCLHPFTPDDLVTDTDSLRTVIQSLGINGRCFVTVLGEVGAIVTLSDLEKPPVRMFLFGMITIFEMQITRGIRMYFPGESWRESVSPGRLAKAEALLQERQRRNSPADLLDCLQFSDRGQLLLRIPEVLEVLQGMGIPSKKGALKAFQELETLRNNLAHSQQIIPDSWERIVVFSTRIETLLGDTLPG